MNPVRSLIPVIFCCLIMSGPGHADHPGHTSLAEIEWNPLTRNLEVAISVWPADLERAVALMRDRPTDLDRVKNLDRILAEYVEHHFVVSSGHSPRHAIQWLGSEIGATEAWLYFEIDGQLFPRDGDQFVIDNRLFIELTEHQVNLVQFKSGSIRQSGTATDSRCRIEFDFRGSGSRPDKFPELGVDL